MTEEKIVKLPKRISLTNIVLLLREDIRGGKRFVTKDAFMYRAKKVDGNWNLDFLALTGKDKGKLYKNVIAVCSNSTNLALGTYSFTVGDYKATEQSIRYTGEILTNKVETYEKYEFVDTNFLSEYICKINKQEENKIWEEIDNQK